MMCVTKYSRYLLSIVVRSCSNLWGILKGNIMRTTGMLCEKNFFETHSLELYNQ